MGVVDAPITTAFSPFHGSYPSATSSGKIQRLPQSLAASSTQMPTARWSAWFDIPGRNRSSWLPVTTTSGLSRRIARQRSRRRPSVGSITPSW